MSSEEHDKYFTAYRKYIANCQAQNTEPDNFSDWLKIYVKIETTGNLLEGESREEEIKKPQHQQFQDIDWDNLL